jgi:hypothetical protein
MGAVDAQHVEHGDDIPNPRGQGVGMHIGRLVAPALPPVIREDQAEVVSQRAGECRRFRNLERIREARVEENGRSGASRVLEIRSDAIKAIRRVGRSLLLPFERFPTFSLVACRSARTVGT